MVAIAALPSLGLGLNLFGLIGAVLIVLFGFLFVTVSSRLTGQIGSSSNPISGMTVATLLLTCLVFLAMGKTDKTATLTALSVAAVVCIASSNGGTTSQDLKTGYPRRWNADLHAARLRGRGLPRPWSSAGPCSC